MLVINLLFAFVLVCFYRASFCRYVMIFQIIASVFLDIRKDLFSTFLYTASVYAFNGRTIIFRENNLMMMACYVSNVFYYRL